MPAHDDVRAAARRAIWTRAALLAGFALAALPAAAAERGKLSIEDYLSRVADDVFSEIDQSKYTDVRSDIFAVAKNFRQQYQDLANLDVPQEAEAAHTALVNTLAAQAAANYAQAVSTPKRLALSDETLNEWLYSSPEIGYARNDEAGAVCVLGKIAKAHGVEFEKVGSACIDGFVPNPGTSVGTKDAPVNDVYILHDQEPVDANGIRRPNVDGFEVSSITASASKPLRIVFDNRNAAPFVFNLAVYRGTADRLAIYDLVGETAAFAGPKVQVVTLTNLEPGDYSYIDNVHPVAMRGKLTVVP